MEISARDYLVIILGVIGTLILTITFGNKLANYQNLSLIDYLLLLVIAIIAIVFVIYKHINELEKEIDVSKQNYTGLKDSLERAEELINIKSDLIALKREIFKNGKKK
jgi:purine-cytosine permease-like protein